MLPKFKILLSLVAFIALTKCSTGQRAENAASMVQKKKTEDTYTIEEEATSDRQEENVALLKHETRLEPGLLKSVVGEDWVYSDEAKVYFTKSEISVSQYTKCLHASKCSYSNVKIYKDDSYCNLGTGNRENHPINCVTADGAKEMCQWLGGRLPTEEEWYAEATDCGRRRWPWGNGPDVDCEHAWWGDGINRDGCGLETTGPICRKVKGMSVSGLCDMSGNVWEWVTAARSLEFYGGSFLTSEPQQLGPNSYRWANYEFYYRTTGIRCVRGDRARLNCPFIEKRGIDDIRNTEPPIRTHEALGKRFSSLASFLEEIRVSIPVHIGEHPRGYHLVMGVNPGRSVSTYLLEVDDNDVYRLVFYDVTERIDFISSAKYAKIKSIPSLEMDSIEEYTIFKYNRALGYYVPQKCVERTSKRTRKIDCLIKYPIVHR